MGRRVTAGTTILRAILGVLPPLVEMGTLLGMGVIFVFAAYLMLKRMEWLAKVEARLSLRWQ